MRSIPFYIFCLFLCFPIANWAQINQGFSFDNYGGVHNVVSNPANSVESKYKFHINAISYNQWNVSDYGFVDLLKTETNPNGFNGLDFSDNNMNPTNQNNVTSNSDVMLPSVIWSFHPKHAVGLIWRSRSFTDYQGFNGNLWARLNETETTPEGVSGVSTFNNTVHQWDEVGLNYATVLINSNYHFLKFGGTIKYLSGRGGVELSGIDPNNTTDPRPNGSITSNETGTAVSSAAFAYLNTFTNELTQPNFASDQPNTISNAFSLQNKGRGIGGDLGFVYEWRPRETNRVGVRNSSSGVNTYKIRISASVLDLGTVNYKGINNEKNNINRRSYSVINPTATPIATDNLEGFFDTLGGSNTATNPIQQGSVSFALPRSLNIGLDYIIFNDKNYYINLNYVHPLTNVEDAFSNMRMQLVTLTPRFETRDFSAYIPITYGVSTSSIHAGIGVRYKYITAGCAALSSFVQDKPLNHIYVGLSLPILEEVFQ